VTLLDSIAASGVLVGLGPGFASLTTHERSWLSSSPALLGHTDPVTCVVGLHSRTGTAEAVALALSGTADSAVAFRGRWSLDLIEDRAERQIYHAAGDLPPARAETIVRRAIDVVADIALGHLRTIIGSLGTVDEVGVIVGDFPVPDSLAAILASHTLMHAAEGALFRDALLDAATACGVRGIGVSRNRATELLGGEYAHAVAVVGSAAGRPWRKDHKLATVAAIVAGSATTRPSLEDR
jgi:hypothetical protein